MPPGGGHCTCPPPPLTAGAEDPATARLAQVSHILMAEKTDTSGDSHNNGTYTMFLRVAQPDKERTRSTRENLNPVKHFACFTTSSARASQRRSRRNRTDASSLSPPRWHHRRLVRNTGAAESAGGGRRAGRPRREAVTLIALSSPAWPDSAIPLKHTQRGAEVSPALPWTNVPETAVSFVLVMHDLDAVSGAAADDTLHWLLWNIPAAARTLPEHVPQGATLADGTRQIGATGPYYRGPAVPAGALAHHYVFELFALDAMLDVPAVGASPAQTRALVIAAMGGHVRGKGVYVGLFKPER